MAKMEKFCSIPLLIGMTEKLFLCRLYFTLNYKWEDYLAYIIAYNLIILTISSNFQSMKRSALKEFVENLPLAPKQRLIPREAVRGGRCDTFATSADSTKESQLFYKDASM